MIPLVPEFVVNVDIPARKMRVRWEDDDDEHDDDAG